MGQQLFEALWISEPTTENGELVINLELSLSNKSTFSFFMISGPNESYWESLKALRVVSRMPAGTLFSFKKQPPDHFVDFRTSQNPETTKWTNAFIGYWIMPVGAPNDNILNFPKHPSLGPSSIPIPTPASDHPTIRDIVFLKRTRSKWVLMFRLHGTACPDSMHKGLPRDRPSPARHETITISRRWISWLIQRWIGYQ